MGRGRPVKYSTLEEVEAICEEYLDGQDEKAMQHGMELPTYTMSGLARRLGLSRQGLCEYGAKELFSDTIKDFRAIVEENIEERLLSGVAQTGCIFNLKNNFDWKDKTEVDSNVKTSVTIIDDIKD